VWLWLVGLTLPSENSCSTSAWAICNGPNLNTHLANGWHVPTLSEVKMHWADLVKIARVGGIGISVLEDFQQTNPLPHFFNENSQMCYFNYSGINYLSVGVDTFLTKTSKLFLMQHELQTPVSTPPAIATPRQATEGYLVLLTNKVKQ